MEPAAIDVLATSRSIDETWLVPHDSVDAVQTDDFLAYLRPAHRTSATYGRVQVWITSPRPFADLASSIERIARGWDASAAQWRIFGELAPGAENWLRSVGASLVLSEAVMARSLEGPDADAWLSHQHVDNVSTTIVEDRKTFDSLVRVQTAGWGRPRPPDEVTAQEWDDLQAGLASSTEHTLLGSIDGVPASVARCVLLRPVVRLFGSVTLPDFRGRGLYSALLAERCRIGRDLGATTALTKARTDTSAPVLERFAFRSYGVEHCWLVPCR